MWGKGREGEREKKTEPEKTQWRAERKKAKDEGGKREKLSERDGNRRNVRKMFETLETIETKEKRKRKRRRKRNV